MTVGSYVSEIAEAFGTYPQVLAVALSGSRLSAHSDEQSDYDLYVYTLSDLPIAFRRSLAGENGELDNRTWEHGDEWIDLSTGSRVEVMYRSPSWIQDRLDDVLQHHRASLGYSTCFWYNVLIRNRFSILGAGIATCSSTPAFLIHLSCDERLLPKTSLYFDEIIPPIADS